MTKNNDVGEKTESESAEVSEALVAQLEANRRTRMQHLQAAAEAIIKRSGQPPGMHSVWLTSMGQTCEMMAVWSVLMARGLVTPAEKEECLNAAYAEFESRINQAAGKIMVGDSVRKALDG